MVQNTVITTVIFVPETTDNHINYKIDFVFQSKYIVHKGTMKFISGGNLNRVGVKKAKT